MNYDYEKILRIKIITVFQTILSLFRYSVCDEKVKKSSNFAKKCPLTDEK